MKILSLVFLIFVTAPLLFPPGILTRDLSSMNLLFSTRKDIRIIDINSKKYNATILVTQLEDATALDYDYQEQILFWSDVGLECIKSTRLNVSEPPKTIVSSGLLSPDGVAVDWVAKNLYWIDSETNKLEVSKYSGAFRKTLIWKDMDQPRSVVLVPQRAFMFWSDWGEVPKIERASMDGNATTRRLIVTKDIHWPNGIAVDIERGRIYWTDAKLKCIASVDLNGNNRQMAIEHNLPHPYGLTLWKKRVIWTDWHKYNIMYIKYNQTEQREIYAVQFPLLPLGVKAYGKDLQASVKTECNENNGGCSHLCLLSSEPPYYTCGCPMGIVLLADRKTCDLKVRNYLLLAKRTGISQVSLDTDDFPNLPIPLEMIKHPTSVDYHKQEGMMYWTDDESLSISRAYLNGSHQEQIVNTELISPDGIAVDWLGHNLFWTDSDLDRIEVARLNGSFRRVIVNDRLNQPRAIVLDSPAGWVYWSDWGKEPKIERAALDGSQRQALVVKDIVWPNGLALDIDQGKLYWADAHLDRIEYSNFDGSQRQVLLSDQLPHIFGLSVVQDWIYWTDWQRRSIERVHKLTGKQREPVVEQLADIMGIKAVSPTYQQGTSPCAHNNGDCSHLCLNRPNNDFVCACPPELELLGRICVGPDVFFYFSQKQSIGRMSLTSTEVETIPIQSIGDVSSLDIDVANKKIYWLDTNFKSLSSAYINGSNCKTLVQDIEYPEGIALDWIAQNIYWVDVGYPRIEVARVNGSSRLAVVWKGLEDPRSLAVDPIGGYLYWSDWGSQARIERVDLDGSERKILIKRIGRANGITIDYNGQRIYWADIDSNKVDFCNLDGQDRRTLNLDYNVRPFAMTVMENSIFYSNLNGHSILKANKSIANDSTVIKSNMVLIKELRTFHPSRQKGWNVCAMNNNKCSHLCFSLPHNMARCGCPSHYVMHNDNKTCSPPKYYISFAQRNAINGLPSLDHPLMSSNLTGAKNIKAIDYDAQAKSFFWLDGKTNSIKRSADNGAKVSIVVPNLQNEHQIFDFALDVYSRNVYFSCMLKNEIVLTRIDGEELAVVVKEGKPRLLVVHSNLGYLIWTNMGDRPKLEFSELNGHLQQELTTVQKPGALAIDVTTDMVYWYETEKRIVESIEINKPEKTKSIFMEPTIHHTNSIQLLDGFIYWINLEIDKIQRANKATGKDFQSFSKVNNLVDLAVVSPYNTSHPCYKHPCSHMCRASNNGRRQCLCPENWHLLDDKTCVLTTICPKDKFHCHLGTNQCIEKKWRCDGHIDCTDGSDEVKCDSACSDDMFQCFTGECIPRGFLCNGFADCKDMSDESCCNHFMCTTAHKCIPLDLKCNTFNDCGDNSDEMLYECAGQEKYSPKMASSTKYTYIVFTIVTILVILLILVGIFFFRKRKPVPQMKEEAGTEMLPRPVHRVYPQPSSCPPPAISYYERAHVTGASSSYSSSVIARNRHTDPHPSPATVRSQFRFPRSQNSSSRERTPLNPTPCSTDVCDSEVFSYDSEPYPPPPTPHSIYISRSPSTDRSYCRPPPPTPVVESDF